MLTALVFGGRHGQKALEKVNHALLYILVGCSGVMLYSAYMRLALYEHIYGYTYIRFLVHAFMILLALLLIIAGFRIRYPRIPLTKCYIVIGLLAYVLVNYIGMDRIIAGNNIERFRETGKIDAGYLADLSADTVPMLIEFSRDEYPLLQNLLKERQASLLIRLDRRWPSFNLAEYRAERALNRYFKESKGSGQ